MGSRVDPIASHGLCLVVAAVGIVTSAMISIADLSMELLVAVVVHKPIYPSAYMRLF